jgi:hypothetical protein
MKQRVLAPVIAVLLLTASIAAAHAFGLGLGNRFGKLGAMGKGGGSAPPVSCASTGIFNLGNVCNDIYFIGALK